MSRRAALRWERPTPHEELVESVCERYGMEATGFGKGLLALAEHLEAIEAEETLPKLVNRGRPDAWKIDLDRCELVLVEVEVGNPMTDHVLSRWADLWLYIDGDNEWTMALWRVDRWGQIAAVSLSEAFSYTVQQQMRERGRSGATPLGAPFTYRGLRC